MAGRIPVRKIRREDIPEAPGWINKVLYSVNPFMAAVASAFNKSITFDENIDVQKKILTFTTASDYVSGTFEEISFPRTTKNKAAGILLLTITIDQNNYSPITEAVSLQWRESNKVLYITYVSGLANATEYVMTVLVI